MTQAVGAPKDIGRQFVRLDEGLVHLRYLEPLDAAARPLFLIHASPGSSRGLEGLMLALRACGVHGAIIAPDTLGNGDSARPAPEQPEISYFADSLRRLSAAMGHKVVDLYGSHTGARIACEFAASFPDLVGQVILDGIADYDPELKAQTLANYAPKIAPDEYGRQMIWAFNFVRDMSLFFPYFMRDEAHRLTGGLPTPESLHLSAIDVLKALDTYQLAYLAVFRYEPSKRLPLIKAPVLFIRSQSELPILRTSADALVQLLPPEQARVVAVSGSLDDKVAAMTSFLSQARS